MELLYKFLESDDERLEKRGLQDFCGFLEKGLTLSTEDKHRLYKLLSKFQNSNSILVRR